MTAIEAACARIPPLWPLRNFVAVNPFLGLSDIPFTHAADLLGRVTPGGMLMDASYFLDRIELGAIQDEDVRSALAAANHPIAPAAPVTWLKQQLEKHEPVPPLATVADWLDRERGTRWNDFVTDEISKWCSSYFDEGQCSWETPWAGRSLYETWKQAAAIDRNPECFGLADFRSMVKQLPDAAERAIEWALSQLNPAAESAADFLHRELMSVFGWSAYARYRDRAGSGEPLLPQLLAIRLAYDVALLSLAPGWTFETGESTGGGAVCKAKYIAQLALENAYRSTLLRRLGKAAVNQHEPRKALHAIFCIDVRSEVFRRALETQSSEIETIGFAGFFGMAIEVAGSARCPVLIEPGFAVRESRPEPSRFETLRRRARKAVMAVRASAVGSFPSVEVAGSWFGFGMLRKFMGNSRRGEPAAALSWHIPLTDQIDLAAQALKNMSLDVPRLAPVVLVCGHGARTENNPFASSLDCGACGGHRGDVNARFAAGILNNPEVREGLLKRGVAIPADTVFLAALHITTTYDIELYDADGIERGEILQWLESASRQARLERSWTLVAGPPLSGEKADREIRRRSVDWSEVRPEWGLAGNAAFIAAPRSRTRGLDLEGRVFLHEYNPATDPDGAVLTLILTAPVVVASWINLQYYGSMVNNAVFGSGRKVLHNVVGGFGVWEGNAGDLRAGLPFESLHDGAKWMHEPLRLQVFIDAPRERIERVLQANPEVGKLVANGWIHLMAMDGTAVPARQ